MASSSVDELVRKAQDELNNISELMRLNELSANPQKTEYMFMGHPNRTNKITEQEKLKLDGSEIKRVMKTNHWGVIIDQGIKDSIGRTNLRLSKRKYAGALLL